jgi:triacylglycerol lipase
MSAFCAMGVLILSTSCASSPGVPSEKVPVHADFQQNSDPVILVPGFLAFTELPLSGIHYWGGTIDLVEELRSAGYRVYAADIGPVSSNHDRACELYAFIRGGVVDYGEAHSLEAGHSRRGREYPGVFPEWGTIDEGTGHRRKVHLIGHSMGGQTARLLASLLAEEGEEAGEWINSITTIATPHNGTTLTWFHADPGSMIKMLVSLVALHNNTDEPMYNLQLDHWEEAARDDEQFSDFVDRVIEEELWLKNKDISWYDLTPKGAEELNRRSVADPGIFYFSIATSMTEYNPRKEHWEPAGRMTIALRPSAGDIGSFDPSNLDEDDRETDFWAETDKGWRENDGIVNSISMIGPLLGSRDRIIPWDLSRQDIPERGVWNYLGKVHLDHLQVTMKPLLFEITPDGYESLEQYYLDICSFLWRLPGE